MDIFWNCTMSFSVWTLANGPEFSNQLSLFILTNTFSYGATVSLAVIINTCASKFP